MLQSPASVALLYDTHLVCKQRLKRPKLSTSNRVGQCQTSLRLNYLENYWLGHAL